MGGWTEEEGEKGEAGGFIAWKSFKEGIGEKGYDLLAEDKGSERIKQEENKIENEETVKDKS